jgi:hypothetical protein
MKKWMIVIVCALVLTGSIRVKAAGPCTGLKYDGHPALVQECLHQIIIKTNSLDPYPGPVVDPDPYHDPYPGPEATPTAGAPILLTPYPTRTLPPMPTEPPPPPTDIP